MVDYLSENTWTSRFSNGSSSKQFCAFLSQQNETFKGLIKGTGVPTTHNTNRGYMGWLTVSWNFSHSCGVPHVCRSIELEPKLLDAYWHRHLLHLLQDNRKVTCPLTCSPLVFNGCKQTSLQWRLMWEDIITCNAIWNLKTPCSSKLVNESLFHAIPSTNSKIQKISASAWRVSFAISKTTNNHCTLMADSGR